MGSGGCNVGCALLVIQRCKNRIGIALDDYKVVLYRNQPSGWVAEIPSIPGCYALMPTRTEALEELGQVLQMIEAEYRDKQKLLRLGFQKVGRVMNDWVYDDA